MKAVVLFISALTLSGYSAQAEEGRTKADCDKEHTTCIAQCPLANLTMRRYMDMRPICYSMCANKRNQCYRSVKESGNRGR